MGMELARRIQRAFFLTLFIYGLLTWVYVVAIQIAHPRALFAPLTHIGLFPFNVRLSLAGILALGISAVGFFLWRGTSAEKQLTRPSKASK